MKFVTFINEHKQRRLGLFNQGHICDLANQGSNLGFDLPNDIISFMQAGEKAYLQANEINRMLISGELTGEYDYQAVQLLAPVPNPPTCRDGYAFRQHVAAARRNRGVEMIDEFDEYPIFYFTNHHTIIGEGNVVVEKDHLEKLDFELELAAVIGKQGKNIDSRYADDYIFGYMIMNDLSARLLQMEEMKLNLGPAKGKDFATAVGPWLVTKDELEEYLIITDYGAKYDLAMTARHNGTLISEGNARDMNWTFAEIIERCSYGVDVYPGDIIGSGTVGTGCYLELNGTWALEAKQKSIPFNPIWLKDGDTIELEISGLGLLSNTIVYSGAGNSILAKKKSRTNQA